jgi:hypothetical protein
MTDIADQELDEEELDNEEKEGGEDQDKTSDRAAADKQTIADLQKGIAELNRRIAQAGSGQAPPVTKREVSKLEDALSNLVKDGYKPEQLAAITDLIAAGMKDVEDKYQSKAFQDRAEGLQKRCQERALEELAHQLGEVELSKNQKAALVADMAELMFNDPKFQSAKAAFEEGRVPSAADFTKAARTVSQIYQKDGGMKQGDKKTSTQLDTKNSRSRPSSAISKDGEVDLTQLSDVERSVYTATLNSLSNKTSKEAKALALNALKTVAPHL